MHEGFLAAANIDLELYFAPSGANVVQQLTARSIDVVVSTGMTESLQAIDKGGARHRPDHRRYRALRVAPSPTIHAIADLRGKIISTGSASDTTNDLFSSA